MRHTARSSHRLGRRPVWRASDSSPRLRTRPPPPGIAVRRTRCLQDPPRPPNPCQGLGGREVGHRRGPMSDEPPHLLVPTAVARAEVEVHSLGRQLRVRDFDEQQAVIAQRITNHALLVTRFIGVVVQVLVPEHQLPPLRQSVRVVAVDRRVRDERRHDTSLARNVGRPQQSVGKDTFDVANDRSTVFWLDRAVRSAIDGSW